MPAANFIQNIDKARIDTLSTCNHHFEPEERYYRIDRLGEVRIFTCESKDGIGNGLTSAYPWALCTREYERYTRLCTNCAALNGIVW